MELTSPDPSAATGGTVHRLDTLGHRCPLPVLLAQRDMMGLAPGARLELLGDDPGIVEDIPAWAKHNGHRLLSLRQEDGVIICLVEKAAPEGRDRESEA